MAEGFRTAHPLRPLSSGGPGVWSEVPSEASPRPLSRGERGVSGEGGLPVGCTVRTMTMKVLQPTLQSSNLSAKSPLSLGRGAGVRLRRACPIDGKDV